MGVFDGWVLRDFFLQQQFHALDALVGVEPLHHHVIRQVVTGCQQDHALVMRHIGLNGGMRLAGWQARFGVIERLVKTKTPKHVQAFQAGHVLQHGLRLQREPKDRRIGCDDQIVLQLTFEAQVRHTKCLVLVVQIDIEGIVA